MPTDYEADRILLEIVSHQLFPECVDDPLSDPVLLLDAERKRAPKRAEKRLEAALRDVLPGLQADERVEIDRLSAARGGSSTTQVLSRTGDLLERIIKRGVIRNDEEFYLVRATLDDTESPDRRQVLERLLNAYEGV